MWIRDLLLIGSTTGLCVVSLVNPVIGILAYFGYSFLAPHAYTYAFSSTFPHVQFLAIATLVGYVFWKEPKKFPKETEFFLLLALWVLFGFSSIFSYYPDRAFDALWHVSKILLMVFLALSLINTHDRLHWFVRVFALALGFYAIKGGLFVIVNGATHMIEGPSGSFIQANTAFGLALVMNVPLLIFLMRTESYVWLRWIEKLMLVLSYPAIIGTFSRGAWLGLAFVSTLILLKSKYKALGISLCVVLFLISPVWLPFVMNDQLDSRFDQLVNYEEESSAQSRFWSWEFCARVGIANPLTGGGFQYYSTELYAKYFPEFRERWGYNRVWSCHNMWLTILGEHGLVAFLLWLCLFGSSLLSLWKLRSRERRYFGSTWIVHFSDMAIVSLLGFMLMGIFLDVAYYEGFYVLLGQIIIVKNLARTRNLTTQPFFDKRNTGEIELCAKTM